MEGKKITATVCVCERVCVCVRKCVCVCVGGGAHANFQVDVNEPK